MTPEFSQEQLQTGLIDLKNKISVYNQLKLVSCGIFFGLPGKSFFQLRGVLYYILASAHTDFCKIKSILSLILPSGYIKLTPQGVYT